MAAFTNRGKDKTTTKTEHCKEKKSFFNGREISTYVPVPGAHREAQRRPNEEEKKIEVERFEWNGETATNKQNDRRKKCFFILFKSEIKFIVGWYVCIFLSSSSTPPSPSPPPPTPSLCRSLPCGRHIRMELWDWYFQLSFFVYFATHRHGYTLYRSRRLRRSRRHAGCVLLLFSFLLNFRWEDAWTRSLYKRCLDNKWNIIGFLVVPGRWNKPRIISAWAV